MKSLRLIRLAAYAFLVAAATLYYFGHRPSAAMRVSPTIDDEGYFYGRNAGDGPQLNSEVLRRADGIEEVALRTEMSQTGIEPLNLRLQKGGRMLRRVTSLSDYTMYDRSITPSSPVLKTVEVAESTTADFERVAYLLAELPYRPLPQLHGIEFSDRLEVSYKDGAKRIYYFASQPPEFWALVQSIHQISATAQWKILERSTAPNQPVETTASAVSHLNR